MKTFVKLMLITVFVASGLMYANASVGDKSSQLNLKLNQPGSDHLVKADQILMKATEVLKEAMEGRENSIPVELLQKSEGIVIFPNAFKLAVGVVGGQGASGIAVVRREDGTWSNTFFVLMREGSLGAQVGAQSSDIIMLFKERELLMEASQEGVTLGADLNLTAGTISQNVSASTDVEFKSDIYTYVRSKGLFAGVNVRGSMISANVNRNFAVYDTYFVEKIVNDIETPFNESVAGFNSKLDSYSE